MATVVSVTDAKARICGLLGKVAGGEEIVITRRGKAVARLIPIEPRRPGSLKGRVTAAFFEPLPPEEIEGWRQ